MFCRDLVSRWRNFGRSCAPAFSVEQGTGSTGGQLTNRSRLKTKLCNICKKDYSPLNLRKLARGRECQIRIPGVCNGNPETTVLCHLNGGGMALKMGDLYGAWGCQSCHDEVDGRTVMKPNLTEVELWFHHGVIRTQKILEDEGWINV